MVTTLCLECDAVIVIAKPRYWAEITCRACGRELEIISMNPFEVDYPLDYDEGWGRLFGGELAA